MTSTNTSLNEDLLKNNLQESDVIDYLKKHPDFFQHNEQLLTTMILSQDSGSATSLLERQVAILRNKDLDLRNKLHTLIRNANDNNVLFENTRTLITALLATSDLAGFISALESNIEEMFDVDTCKLTLFSDEQSDESLKFSNQSEARKAHPGILETRDTMCGVFRDKEYQFLFGKRAKNIQSAAISQLQSHASSLGILALGSSDPSYFRKDLDTLFLTYISDIVCAALPQYLKKHKEQMVV